MQLQRASVAKEARLVWNDEWASPPHIQATLGGHTFLVSVGATEAPKSLSHYPLRTKCPRQVGMSTQDVWASVSDQITAQRLLPCSVSPNMFNARSRIAMVRGCLLPHFLIEQILQAWILVVQAALQADQSVAVDFGSLVSLPR